MPWVQQPSRYVWVEDGKVAAGEELRGRFVLDLHNYRNRPRVLRAHAPSCVGPCTLELTPENLVRALEGASFVNAREFGACVLRHLPLEEQQRRYDLAERELEGLTADEVRAWRAAIEDVADVEQRFELRLKVATEYRTARGAVLWELVEAEVKRVPSW